MMSEAHELQYTTAARRHLLQVAFSMAQALERGVEDLTITNRFIAAQRATVINPGLRGCLSPWERAVGAGSVHGGAVHLSNSTYVQKY